MIEQLEGSLIVVTINYRLNVFGFAGSGNLLSPEGSTGNWGILDQRLAFEWVQNNIQAFNGDPSKVTIFGESPGAGSVSVHMSSPGSWGYFNKAIGESGSFSQWVAQPMSVTESRYSQLRKIAGCGTSDACLSTISASFLFSVSASLPLVPSIPGRFSCGGSGFGPTVDGIVLPSHPYVLASTGGIADKPFMFGTNTDEGSSFFLLPHNTSDIAVEAFWKEGASTTWKPLRGFT